jgi:hypothetical protein
MINKLGIDQIVDFPTRKDNILDLFCTNQSSLINKVKSIPGISDHNIILVGASCNPKRSIKDTQHKIYLWKKTNMNDLKNLTSKFESELLTKIDTKTTVNQWWIKFRDGINKIMEDNVPSKMTKSKFTNHWANTKIDKLCKQQRKAFNKANKTGKQEHKDKYKQIKTSAQREIRRAQSNYMQEIISPQLDEKPKSFWQ